MIDDEIAKLEKEIAKSKRDISLQKRDINKEFRIASAHVKNAVGGEWFAYYTKTKIMMDSNFSQIIEDEKERMRKMYNSLPLCPMCKIGRLINEGDFWQCDNEECNAHVKVITQ